MLDVVFAQLIGLANNWKGQAAGRRKFTTVDPVADTIDYQAGELESLVERLKRDTELLTAEQYAKLHDTTPQTVNAWCRMGKVEGAIPKGRSFLIPRNTTPPKFKRVKRTA